MHGTMWLVACGCGADDAFEAYGEARRWQDAHAGVCEGRTDLWAPDSLAETLAGAPVEAARPLPAAVPQVLRGAHA